MAGTYNVHAPIGTFVIITIILFFSQFSYPIIADPERDVATLYGMMDPDEKDSAGLPLTCRSDSFCVLISLCVYKKKK